tara:strand:- start:465 stop:644 length:180 start_codon:yes stop_codon:yes gene_type:complete
LAVRGIKTQIMSNGKDLFWASESADALWENDFRWADAKALRGPVWCYNTVLRADGPRSP